MPRVLLSVVLLIACGCGSTSQSHVTGTYDAMFGSRDWLFDAAELAVVSIGGKVTTTDRRWGTLIAHLQTVELGATTVLDIWIRTGLTPQEREFPDEGADVVVRVSLLGVSTLTDDQLDQLEEIRDLFFGAFHEAFSELARQGRT